MRAVVKKFLRIAVLCSLLVLSLVLYIARPWHKSKALTPPDANISTNHSKNQIFLDDGTSQDSQDAVSRTADTDAYKIQKVLSSLNISGNTSAASQGESKHTKYAVFGCTTPMTTAVDKYSLVFTLPLTSLAWLRIGYRPAILLIGSKEEWISDELLQYVLSKLVAVNAALFFVNSPLDNRIMMSQVGRLFVTTLFRDHFNADDVIVTTDADLWPIDADAYKLPTNKSFLLLNAYCCGNFRLGALVFHMYPMANVGAKVRDWQKLVSLGGEQAASVERMMSYLEKIFGDLVSFHVEKGENEGWYIDQQLLSVLIARWSQKYNHASLLLKERDVGNDRIDRNGWRVPSTLQGRIDAHMLDNLYEHSQMFKVLPLVRKLYENSPVYEFVLEYFEGFNRLLQTAAPH